VRSGRWGRFDQNDAHAGKKACNCIVGGVVVVVVTGIWIRILGLVGNVVVVVLKRDKPKAPGFFEGFAFESCGDHSQSCKPLLSGFFCFFHQGSNGLCPRPGLVLLLLELWVVLDETRTKRIWVDTMDWRDGPWDVRLH